MEVTLQNKLALVTGASGVIGAATASALHRLGARLILHGNSNAHKLDALVSSLGPACSADIVTADLSTGAGMEMLASMAESRPIDILVNNAGIVGGKPLFAASPGDTAMIINVGYRAARLLSEKVLPGMLQRGSGRIVNISSPAGILGDTGRSAYAAAKAALLGLTLRLAAMASGNVTVNAVLPGYVSGTPAVTGMDGEKAAQLLDLMPSGRFIEPGDVAHAVAVLASAEAGSINGSFFRVDGGLVAQAILS
ncbi:MAG: SDR family oxidoreductase [Planctomycetes bacterium]|nr:SDR family oxidoreductase [Planctomycetota bacterium]